LSEHHYPVEVEGDFLEKITRAKPIQAVAEFVWNSLDADATEVAVSVDDNPLGAMSQIIVRDNGTGIPYESAPDLFKKLGGSWKRATATTKTAGRFLHGQDGRGRFKAFGLGTIADWKVTYRKPDNTFWIFTIRMTASKIKEVVISDEQPAQEESTGVTLRISNLHQEYPSLVSESGFQEFAEIFALYLVAYKDVTIAIEGRKIGGPPVSRRIVPIFRVPQK
jgi:hypothetical protein